MSIMTAICVGVFASVLFTIDPFSTNYVGFILFYVSLFLSLSGIFAIFGFAIRFIIFRRTLVFYLVADAFRQAILLSLTLCTALFLLSKDLFNWLNFILLLIATAILEYILLSGRPRRRHAPIENENNN
jgi:hypothetical protein